MSHVIYGTVQKEPQFGDYPELMTYPLAKIIADILYIVVYVLYSLLAFFGRKNAQVNAGYAQVTANLDSAYRNHQTFCKFCLLQEQFAQFLLDEP